MPGQTSFRYDVLVLKYYLLWFYLQPCSTHSGNCDYGVTWCPFIEFDLFWLIWSDWWSYWFGLIDLVWLICSDLICSDRFDFIWFVLIDLIFLFQARPKTPPSKASRPKLVVSHAWLRCMLRHQIFARLILPPRSHYTTPMLLTSGSHGTSHH
jgi:hypothetical protein